MKTWYSVTNLATQPAAEIDLFDEIGLFGVTVADFAKSLAAIPADRDISLRINSPGGSVFDGFALLDILSARRERLTCRVVGLAASMASIVMLTGKRTEAAANATIMIHNPAALVGGGSDEMRSMAELLDKLKGRLVNCYAQKTGKSTEEISKAMDATTYFTAEEAKAFGLVDAITEPVSVKNCHDLTRFGSIPDRIAATISAGGNTAGQKNKPTDQANMNKLLIALAEVKLIASADTQEDSAAAQVRASFAQKEASIKSLSDENTQLKAKLEKAEAELKTALTARAKAAVDALVKDKRIVDNADLRQRWVDAYIADEAGTQKLFASLPEPAKPRGADPVTHKKDGENGSAPFSLAATFQAQYDAQKTAK